jgi:hypothetical protein
MRSAVVKRLCFIIIMGVIFIMFGCSPVDSNVEPTGGVVKNDYNLVEEDIPEIADADRLMGDNYIVDLEISVLDDPLFIGSMAKDPYFTADVNLTELNSIMLSGTIAHINNNKEEYVGKTTHVRGMYFNFFSDASGSYVNVILIEDQAGCCQYGFEFRIDEQFYDLNTLPMDGGMIEFRGVFQICNLLEHPIIYLLTEFVHIE